jgi:hypothetical protein
MISPIIICNGVIRSGSTWSFNVCRLLGQLLSIRRGQQFGSGYLSAETLDQFLESELDSRDGPAVIKAHEIGPIATEWVRTGRAKAVCTIRDPRDCVASDVAFWQAGFDVSLRRVATSLKFVVAYRDFGRTLFIRYEEMMANQKWQIKQIADYLQIGVDQKEIDSIDAQTGVERCRKICEDLDKQPANDSDTLPEAHRRDRVTLLHDNHIGTTEVNRWKHDLTPQQGQLVSQLFQRSLEALGYTADGCGMPLQPRDR